MRITGGKYNSRKIKAVEFDNIKPTLSKTRQGIFNTLASMMEIENKIFFDMFAGSAIMSLEAISRGFRVISFEKDKKTALAIKETFKTFDIIPELYFGDALKNVLKINLKPDVVFLDPPYDSNLYETTLSVLKTNNIIKPNSVIIMEHTVDKNIKYGGFKLIKAKIYGNKQITYINQAE